MTKEELLMILNYAKDNNLSEAQSAKKFGFCKDLWRYKIKYNIPCTKRKINIDKQIIINIINESLKEKVSYKKICKKYNISDYIFQKYKKIYNIQIDKNINYTGRKQRKYNVNDSFFDKLNELNCYYGGFIAADGYVRKEDGSINLELAEKDKCVIENFKKDLKTDAPIKEHICKKIFKMNSISFTSYRIKEKLFEHFNITPSKSLTLQPPNINEEKLKYCFICGYLDGDGTIVLYQRAKKDKKELSITILGTKEMCEWIKETFNKLTNNRGSISLKTNTRIYKITYTLKAARQIFQTLYELPIPKLERKWKKEIYEHCITFVRGHNHTFKNVNVFDLYGNLLKKCRSIIYAAEYTNCNCSSISKLAIEGSNRHQSNGYMFSREEKMEKFVPYENPKQKGMWNKIRKKLIEEGKINSEDFLLN